MEDNESIVSKEEALSDQELDQVAGGYDETKYNKDDCANRRTFEVVKCSFCTRCKIMYGQALCDGIMCNTVHYFCMYRPGSGSLMCTHYSLPSGQTEKIVYYDNN